MSGNIGKLFGPNGYNVAPSMLSFRGAPAPSLVWKTLMDPAERKNVAPRPRFAEEVPKGATFAWHWSGETLSHGGTEPIKDNTVYSVEGEIQACSWGLHGSEKLSQALPYAPNAEKIFLSRVAIWGDVKTETDKLVGRHRFVYKVIDASDVIKKVPYYLMSRMVSRLRPVIAGDLQSRVSDFEYGRPGGAVLAMSELAKISLQVLEGRPDNNRYLSSPYDSAYERDMSRYRSGFERQLHRVDRSEIATLNNLRRMIETMGARASLVPNVTSLPGLIALSGESQDDVMMYIIKQLFSQNEILAFNIQY